MEDYRFLDSILVEVGEFGWYQKRICFFILIVTSMTCFGNVIYVFSAKQINHRCIIPECESNVTEFEPTWWKYAIPAVNGQPAKCSKFRRLNNNKTCYASDFDSENVNRCDNFVYESTEVSILHDFNLQCKENVWKLTLVGTTNGAGLFIGLPISGILSDRFGRKTVVLCVMVSSGIIGIILSFSNSYSIFLVLEFIGSLCRAGGISILYTLAVELVGPKNRALVTLLSSFAYATGGIFTGLIAWHIQSWRNIVRVVYGLNLTVIIYYWLIPESIRWLLIKAKFSEAQEILKNVAEKNGKTISQESLDKIELCISNKKSIKTDSVKSLFTSLRLILRLINCSTCWICCIFVYYGLTINSVELSNNSYFNFVLSFVVEIPGAVVAFVLLDKLGRRLTLSCGFFISGLSCIGSIFIYKDLIWLKTLIYLLGKFGITMCICSIYPLTSEIFPTPFRNTLLATCSMFGRIGAIVAPQMPLFTTIWEPLPLTLFGCAGLLATALTLLLPETKNIKLPSTIEEALNIGKLNRTI